MDVLNKRILFIEKCNTKHYTPFSAELLSIWFISEKQIMDLFTIAWYISDKPANNSDEWCSCSTRWRWWRCSANAYGQSAMCCLWYFCHLVSTFSSSSIWIYKIGTKVVNLLKLYSPFLCLCVQYEILFTKKNKSMFWKWEKFNFEIFHIFTNGK